MVKQKRTFVQWLMFISSYAPLYTALLIQNFGTIWYKKPYQIVHHSNPSFKSGGIDLSLKGLAFSAVMMLLIIFSVLFVIMLLLHKPAAHSIIVSEIAPSRDTIISYIVTYILPLVSLDINSISSLAANIFIFLLIGLLYVRLDLIYLNPIMAVFGYVPYFSGNRVIISNVKFQIFRSHKYRKWRGTHISSTIVLIRAKDNP